MLCVCNYSQCVCALCVNTATVQLVCWADLWMWGTAAVSAEVKHVNRLVLPLKLHSFLFDILVTVCHH